MVGKGNFIKHRVAAANPGDGVVEKTDQVVGFLDLLDDVVNLDLLVGVCQASALGRHGELVLKL